MAHTKNAPAPLLGAAISSCVLLASFPLRSESFAPGNPLSRAVRDPSAIPFSDNVPFFAGFRHKSGNVAGSTGVEMASLAPSKISDPDGPTPEKAPFEPTVVDAAEVEAQMEYDPETSVVPHQPWRRGDANGCEEPVDAQWRLEAEFIMEQAAAKVGAHVDDVTWYLTFATVTLSPDLSSVEVDQDLLSPGPKIAVDSTSYRTNLYLDGEEDEEDPAGFEMGTFSGEEHTRGVDWEDDYEEDDVQGPEYDEDTGEELPRERNRPTRAEAVFSYQKEMEANIEERASTDRALKLPGIVQPHNLKDDIKARYGGYVKEINDFEALLEAKYGYSLRDSGDGGDSEGVTEEDLSSALKICNIEWGLENERLRQYQEFILEKYRLVESYQGVNRKVNDMDVRADGITEDYATRLSIVGQAILEALGEDDADSRLDILGRHEIILTSTNFDINLVETQRQFDAARGKDVFVHTRDPWESNRVLKGKLIDRNTLDVVINQSGRMVTIPNNMVESVRLPNTRLKEREAVVNLVEGLEQASAAFDMVAEEVQEDQEGYYDEDEYEDFEEDEDFDEVEEEEIEFDDDEDIQ